MPRVNVHEIWRFKSEVDKETGEIRHGLFTLIGQAGTVVEMKKRCLAEIAATGEPLAGCAYYRQMIMGWAELCISNDNAWASDWREQVTKLISTAGAHEIVEYIADIWKEHEARTPLREDVQYEAMSEIKEIFDEQYGDVATDLKHLSAKELEKSKLIALELGKRKRRAKPAAPAPEEPTPEPVHQELTQQELEAKIHQELEAKIRQELAG